MATGTKKVPTAVGLMIGQAFERTGHNQTTLAHKIGVSPGTISQVMLGAIDRSKYLPDIASELGIDLGELIAASGERPMATEQTKTPRIGVSERNNRLASIAAIKPLTLIRALHDRYEVIDRNYNLVDEARTRAEDKRTHHLDDACNDIDRELDAIRQAILLQRIENREDLAIAAYHLYIVADMLAAKIEARPGDVSFTDLINFATETMFDFVVGEGFADMERVGPAFCASAMRCHQRRQDREGESVELEVAA